MKITRKRLVLYIIVIMVLTLLVNTPIAQASFADFTDEQADKQAQEQIKEQEKQHNITEVKSSDNYLTNLQIDGYRLTPEFDKQTLEYTIDGDIKTDEVNINATPSNEENNEYRIDVTAENGSVRTYIIKLKEIEKTEQQKNGEAEQTEGIVEQNNSKIEDENTNQNLNNEQNASNLELYTIIAVLVIIILALLIVIMHKRRKSKH